MKRSRKLTKAELRRFNRPLPTNAEVREAVDVLARRGLVKILQQHATVSGRYTSTPHRALKEGIEYDMAMQLGAAAFKHAVRHDSVEGDCFEYRWRLTVLDGPALLKTDRPRTVQSRSGQL